MRTLSGILLLSVLPGCSSGSEPDQTSTAPSGSQIRSHAVEMSAQPAALSPAEAPAGQQMVSDPAGPGQGDFLVLCSGSFSDTGHLRSASRYASQRDCRIGVNVLRVTSMVTRETDSPGRKVCETEPGRNNPDCGIARSGCGSQRMDQSDVAGWSTGDPEHSLLSDRNQSCCTWRQQSGRADVRLCLSSSDAAAVRLARSVLCAVTG